MAALPASTCLLVMDVERLAFGSDLFNVRPA